MFVSVSREASECRLYAEHCADKARLQSDPQLRQCFFEMQRRWLSLARSYEFAERLEFLSAVEERRSAPNDPRRRLVDRQAGLRRAVASHRYCIGAVGVAVASTITASAALPSEPPLRPRCGAVPQRPCERAQPSRKRRESWP